MTDSLYPWRPTCPLNSTHIQMPSHQRHVPTTAASDLTTHPFSRCLAALACWYIIQPFSRGRQSWAVLSPASACALPSPGWIVATVEGECVERTGGAPHPSVLRVSPAVAAASNHLGCQVWPRRSPSAVAISPACPLMVVLHQTGGVSPARPCPALVVARAAVLAQWAAMDLSPPRQRPYRKRHRRQRCRRWMYRACDQLAERFGPRVHDPTASWAGWVDPLPRLSRGPRPRQRR